MRLSSIGLPCVVVAAALAACAVRSSTTENATPAAVTLQSERRGAHLYQRYCAVCHGLRGRGDGLPEGTLQPPARDFSKGLFNLASTENGMPSDADLDRVLVRGMPGSAMPSFAWLSTADRKALIRHVRVLSESEMVRDLLDVADATGRELTEDQAIAQAREALRPGRRVDVPPSVEATPAILKRGQHLYARLCAACHGTAGTGRIPIAEWAGRRKVHWARDFTAGILRGGASHEELGYRILAGMPASAMPPSTLTTKGDLVALIEYVKTLLKEGADERLVQSRRDIVVRRVATTPSTLDDPGWKSQAPIGLTLSPLHWTDNALLHAEVRAVHDGEQLALLISWPDRTRNDPANVAVGRSDAVAVQFSREDEPTFFGMGSKRHPVNIWFWRAQSATSESELLDLVRPSPHKAMTDVPAFVAAPRGKGEVETVVARGHQSAREFVYQDRGVEAVPRFADGWWRVMFRRRLVTEGAKDRAAEITFRPGERMQIAFALWNGANAVRASQKSFTIWHDFTLE